MIMQLALTSLAAIAVSSLTLAGCDRVAGSSGTRVTSQATDTGEQAPLSVGVGHATQIEAPANGVESYGKLLVLGDSYSVAPPFRAAFEQQFPNLDITYDSRGGSSLAQQYERLQQNPETKGWPLLILDGGLTDFDPQDQIAKIVDFQNAHCNLWFYVEPVRRAYPNKRVQQRRMRVIDRLTTHFETEYPGHLIQWNEEVAAQADGTQNDKFAIQDGLMPDSLRKDMVHLNERGYGLLAGIIAREIKSSQLDEGC
ncbi:hypothetical protein ACFCW2_13360 [Qipengyuania sp. DSG2-2]|uniref:hypothetical protein n=1 Tax=Qipengyuania sp. DGS2-2 TaxID=3349631 RepID=UPI0036D27E56